ncbi:MAG: GNAT family N-acetyltransferase [Phycisphaerae bacterium]|jgi:RimJ/RimL family protein N-acetyltransferase
MTTRPARRPLEASTLRLLPFDAQYADLVASWVVDDAEALWLAPKTPPPITAEQVRDWTTPGHEPLMLCRARREPPVAYGELNVLSRSAGHFWLGHLLVAPARRGRGVGRALTEALLRRAFHRRGANRVSLVVFPENRAAVACYFSAGMREVARERHYLRPYEREAELVRLTTIAAP